MTKDLPDLIFNFVERAKCECCGSNDLSILLEREFTDPSVFDFIEACYHGNISKNQLNKQQYTIVKCHDCSFLFQKYILDDASMAIHYETSYDSQLSLNKRENAPFNYFHSLCRSASVIHEIFPNNAPRSIQVMDFGMGWGHWAIAADALGFSVKGCELSQKRIEFAQKHGVDTITDIESDSMTYDFINTDQVFEHLGSPYEVGKLLVNKLNPGGILKIFVPNGNNAEVKLSKPDWKASKNEIQPLEHINCFTWNSMLTFTKRLGLEPLKLTDFKSSKKKILAYKQLHYDKNPSWYFVKSKLK